MTRKLAIISVWDKTGIIELSQSLIRNGYVIVSTGGTWRKIHDALTAEQGGSDPLARVRGTPRSEEASLPPSRRRYASLEPTTEPDRWSGEYPSLVQVSDLTGFPEVLGGRVKTLHPIIHAGILARTDQQVELQEREIDPIHIVIANLYPFSETVATGADENDVLENIDIGGHTLIRAAAKSYQNTLVLTNPADYPQLILRDPTSFTEQERREFAAKAFSHAAEYDIHIAQYFGDQSVRKYNTVQQLKYGCNPQQNNATLATINTPAADSPLTVLNGSVGYINLLDALLGFQLVTEAQRTLGFPAAASYKHTSPAGVAIAQPLTAYEQVVFDVQGRDLSPQAIAFIRARNCDPLSSFGDFIAISDNVDRSTAELIKREVSDGIIAPSYDPEALDILRSKKGGGYIILQCNPDAVMADRQVEYREIMGVAISQAPNRAIVTPDQLTDIPTTNRELPHTVKQDLVLANIALKYTQSNSVAYAYGGQVIGIGAGQQNRVDCVKLAGRKARRWCWRFTPFAITHLRKLREGRKRTEINNAMSELFDNEPLIPLHHSPLYPSLSLASDAFFPFPDSIQVAAEHLVKYVLQPGGSNGDQQCINACNENGMTMVMTGKRMFLH